MKHCGNCANYVWGDGKTELPSNCVRCVTTHVPNGMIAEPSNWKSKPATNADRIRSMSDEELAQYLAILMADTRDGVAYSTDEDRWFNWLQQPAEECG